MQITTLSEIVCVKSIDSFAIFLRTAVNTDWDISMASQHSTGRQGPGRSTTIPDVAVGGQDFVLASEEMHVLAERGIVNGVRN